MSMRRCLLLIPYLGYGIEADNAPVHCLVHQHVQPEKAMVHVAVDTSLVSFQEQLVFLPEILVNVLEGDVVLIQRIDKVSQILLPCPLVQKGLSGFCGSIPFHYGIAKTQQVFSCRVLVLQHSLQQFHGDDAIGGKK